MVPYALYETTLKDKTGELLVAVGAEAWEKTSRGGSEGSERQSLGGP